MIKGVHNAFNVNALHISKAKQSKSYCAEMPFNQRLKIFEAIKGSTIHQSLSTPSSEVAMTRCQGSILTEPGQTLEVLRVILQQELNSKIQALLAQYLESHIRPAVANMRRYSQTTSRSEMLLYALFSNLGEENVPVRAADELCISILEHAKEVYQCKQAESPRNNTKHRSKSPGQVLKRSTSSASNSPVAKKSCVIKSGLGRPNTDLILVNKAGRPVRREGPKWEPDRLDKDTLFILGSRANKALGFGQTRGRLYIKHPELFKYSGDQTDKEWLAKANLMATTGGKAYLMVLADILQLAQSPEYSSHPKQQPAELVGFTVPQWMIEKMRAYIETAKTNPDTTDEELLRLAEEWNGELDTPDSDTQHRMVKKVVGGVRSSDSDISLDWAGEVGGGSTTASNNDTHNVAALLQEIKGETMDDDLQNLDPAFLQGMNLHNLVREFEMEAGGGGSELGGILALADDCLN